MTVFSLVLGHSVQAILRIVLLIGEGEAAAVSDKVDVWTPSTSTRCPCVITHQLSLPVSRQTTTGAPDMQLSTPFVARQQVSATCVAHS